MIVSAPETSRKPVNSCSITFFLTDTETDTSLTITESFEYHFQALVAKHHSRTEMSYNCARARARDSAPFCLREAARSLH